MEETKCLLQHWNFKIKNLEMQYMDIIMVELILPSIKTFNLIIWGVLKYVEEEQTDVVLNW